MATGKRVGEYSGQVHHTHLSAPDPTVALSSKAMSKGRRRAWARSWAPEASSWPAARVACLYLVRHCLP